MAAVLLATPVKTIDPGTNSGARGDAASVTSTITAMYWGELMALGSETVIKV
jgi:hypothetical protein